MAVCNLSNESFGEESGLFLIKMLMSLILDNLIILIIYSQYDYFCFIQYYVIVL